MVKRTKDMKPKAMYGYNATQLLLASSKAVTIKTPVLTIVAMLLIEESSVAAIGTTG